MLRGQNNQYTKNRVPAYYARNKVYPDSHARVDWQTRTSRRVHDGLSLPTNYGLDTTSDDINESPYSSPYYTNGRYNSDNLVVQRSSAASVQGCESLLMIRNYADDFTDSDVQTTLEMWQGKQIRFEVEYNGKIVGNTIGIKNTGGSTGLLSLYLSTTPDGEPIYETTIDLKTVNKDHFEHKTVYCMTPIMPNITLHNKLYARLEIWDEIEKERSQNPFNTGRKIEIQATGIKDHTACVYELGPKNLPARETYDYKPYPSCPLIGLIYNNYKSIPVDRTENEKNGATISLNGYDYNIFCIKDDSHAEVLIYDVSNNSIVAGTDIAVDGRVEQLNIAQVTDTNQNTWVYYVDGYSPLQKFKIGEWQSSAIIPTDPEDDSQPALAASIIVMHNNRLYLAGFRGDPNLVQISAIDATGPTWEVMPYRIYTPNRSPYDTSTNPVRAIVEYTNDQLMILGDHFVSMFQSNINIEDGTPSQVGIFTDGIGIQSQGDVCNYKGVIYSFDPVEGIRYYAGAVWKKVAGSGSIDSLFSRVDMSKPRKLWGYSNKLYLNYTDMIDGKRKALIWDMGMNYQQYPWFQDTDIPFCDIRFGHDFNLVGIHPDFPCIMRLYAKDVWRRLDTPIVFERHTKYISIPGNANDAIIKRVHNKVLANSDRWWFFSVSPDKQFLKQVRGKDSWFRVPCWNTVQEEEPTETPFPKQDIYEQSATIRLTLSNLKIRCSAIQEKIKCKTFRAQANLVSVLFESGVEQYD